MKWLAHLIAALLRATLPFLFKEVKDAARDSAEDTSRTPELRNRLRKKVRDRWKSRLLFPIAILLIPGCGVRTIYVPHGEPVRLRETVKDAKVWVLDADGKPVAGKMDLPEGWYALPVEKEKLSP